MIAGWALIVAGLYFGLGPWSIATDKGSYFCGVPFMGRYSSPPDTAAQFFTACWDQAQARRLAGDLFVLGGALVLVACAVLRRMRARRSSI